MKETDALSMDFGQPSRSDADLVQMARRGDDAAFHLLVDRHAKWLYAIALRLVDGPADAEDVLQETFAGAYQGLRTFRLEASAKTWLTQILVRQAAKYRRQARKHKASSLDFAASARDSGSAQAGADARMDVDGAIRALSPEHREVIVLRQMQGLAYDEIAVILGVPVGTVESRLFRARRQLQELLRDYLP